jgi:ATP-binding cassette, subfamily C (CFTR/MRP), member 1
LLFDTTQTRTLWLAAVKPDEFTYCRLFTTSVAIKAVLILLESQNKTRWMRWDAKDHSPEETAGLFGLSAFAWVNRLFLRGYSRILSLSDLFPLDQHMAANALYASLNRRAEASRLNTEKPSKHWLPKALAQSLAVQFLLPVAPRIALTGFHFCQPFLISSVIDYLSLPASESDKNTGYGLIGAAFLIYAGIAVSNAIYWYFQERAMFMARAVLAGAVYRKTTEAKVSAADDSAALTLMSADVERIRTGFLFIHEFWANPIEIALASWLLQRQLGTAFVAPLLVVLFCVGLSTVNSRLVGKRQKVWMQAIQKRVGLTANVISQMKHLKISGLVAPVETLIQKLRLEELSIGSRFRLLICFSSTIAFTPLTISPVMTYAVTSERLDVNTIFTSFSFLLLLASPLTFLFQMVPGVLAAWACLGRIQAFLDKDPRIDYRESPANGNNRKILSEKNSIGKTVDSPSPSLTISQGNFSWESDENKFGLRGLELKILASNLTMVVGPVGSGKSTLCKVLLGEAPVAHGHVILDQIVRKVGYCDQVPHLTNATIRENIIGYAAYDAERYHAVVEATMLEPDFLMLPQGDQSNIGSNGIALSGGQKQRVSMARALYLNTNLFVFDDILSGLDADTEEQVFRRVFGPDGLLRRRNATAVLCTHSVRHLPAADHIVALGTDGSVVEQGTFADLLANNSYVQSLGVKEREETASTDDITPVNDRREQRQELMKAITAKSATEEAKQAEKTRQTGDTTVYLHYWRSLTLGPVISFLVCGCGFGFFINWGTLWLKYWSEDISAPTPVHANSYYIGLYALFQVLCLVCFLISCVSCFTYLIEVSGANLHRAALKTVITAPLMFFTKTDTGVVTNLFSQDMTLIDMELPNSLLNMALDSSNVLGQACVIAASSPWLAITFPFLFGLMYGIQKFYLRTSRQLRLLDLEAKSPL